jgi:hypothetical protein
MKKVDWGVMQERGLMDDPFNLLVPWDKFNVSLTRRIETLGDIYFHMRVEGDYDKADMIKMRNLLKRAKDADRANYKHFGWDFLETYNDDQMIIYYHRKRKGIPIRRPYGRGVR